MVDAKYEAEKPSGFPQADTYQMLAYCTVLGLPVGHLVYAEGNQDSSDMWSGTPASGSSPAPSIWTPLRRLCWPPCVPWPTE